MTSHLLAVPFGTFEPPVLLHTAGISVSNSNCVGEIQFLGFAAGGTYKITTEL